MTVREFLYELELRGTITIGFAEGPFVLSEPITIPNIHTQNINTIEENRLVRKYLDMDIVSMSANTGKCGVEISVGCR